MSVYGIIAEYNPFHNGHLHQINIIRKKDSDAKIIAVMSGPFSQRGEPAILNKWQRAEAAVKSGINLILELPVCFAISSAQDFAWGGVTLLKRTGSVDKLSFGAECDDVDKLISIANASIYTDESSAQMKKLLDTGLPFAQARTEAISYLFSNKDELAKATKIYPRLKNFTLSGEELQSILRSPNNILAIEYLKALGDSKIEPFLIYRNLSSHADENFTGRYSSGSSIRKQILGNIASGSAPYSAVLASALPDSTQNILEKLSAEDIPLTDNLYRTLQYILRLTPIAALLKIYGIREGIENRLKKTANISKSYGDLVRELQTRRYPIASVQRLLLYILLNLRKKDMETFISEGPQYARVLASDSAGFKLINQMRKKGCLEIVTKTTHFLDSAELQHPEELSSMQQMLSLDIKAQELWSLCLNEPKTFGLDFYTSPIIIKQ